jgi:tetratricopeptide (TPR) repeat protein
MCRGKADLRRILQTFSLTIAIMMIAIAPARADSLSDFLKRKIEQARMAESERMYDVALSAYREAIERSVGTSEGTRSVLKKRAALYEQLHLFDKAEEDLTRAFSLEPAEAKDFIDRGYFYMRRARYRDAFNDFMEGARRDAQDPLYIYGAARALAASREYDNAVKFYGEAIKLDSSNGKFFLGRAEALVNLGRLKEALTDYDRAFNLGLKDKVDRLYAFSGRGYVSLLLQDYDGAVRNFDQALGIDPDAPNALLWRAHANERRGQLPAALHDYERAAALLSDSVPARDGVTRLRAQLSQPGAVTR